MPRSGSFEEKVLSEVIIRERNEKFSVVALFARLIGAVGSIDEKIIDNLLSEYREELYQLRYNYKYVTSQEENLRERVQEAARDARRMQRVESMTVSDEEIARAIEERKRLDDA